MTAAGERLEVVCSGPCAYLMVDALMVARLLASASPLGSAGPSGRAGGSGDAGRRGPGWPGS
ncbi:MAG TPA: hypothetical protein VMU51_38560 [Mycobacteriales bacterium]|nr:hypothetical protein [Mycobacteriales bacterium]